MCDVWEYWGGLSVWKVIVYSPQNETIIFLFIVLTSSIRVAHVRPPDRLTFC